jgi:uncharacterized protein (TIGR03546 family)
MLSPVVAILRKVLSGLLASNGAEQLAAGFTLGMMIGLVPKGNLIVLSLCVLLFSLRVNKGMALVAAILFSAISPFADSFTHKLGLAVLNTGALQSTYALAFSLPLGPWFGFHNTVVAGSLALGLYIAYPVYWSSRLVCTWLRPAALGWINKRRPVGVMSGRTQEPASRTAA